MHTLSFEKSITKRYRIETPANVHKCCSEKYHDCSVIYNKDTMNKLDTICREDIRCFNKTQPEGHKATTCPYEHCRYAELRENLGLEPFTMDDLHNEPDDHSTIRSGGALGGVSSGLD